MIRNLVLRSSFFQNFANVGDWQKIIPKILLISFVEIVEGNRRAIMRLILALAAHFKPGSVRATGNNSDASYGKLERASSTMSLAAEAAVALADASKLASSAGLSLHYKYK